MDGTLLDKDWVSKSFMAPPEDISAAIFELKMSSSADNKFTDTSPGGSLPLNPFPQSNQMCDPPVQGRLKNRVPFNFDNLEDDHGMGIFYSEAYDDNNILLYAEMGVPTFTNIFSYLLRSYDRETAIVATTGRSPLAYEAGKIFGTFIAVVSFPAIAAVVLLGKAALSFLPELTSSQYYSLKPTMHTFWSGVNVLVNNMAMNLGFSWFDTGKGNKERVGLPMKPNKEDIAEFNRVIPGIINDDGFIDVLALVNRAQVLLDKNLTAITKAVDKGNLDQKTVYNLFTGSMERPGPGSTNKLLDTVWSSGGFEYGKAKDFIKNNLTPDLFKSEDEMDNVTKVNKDGTYNPLPGKNEENKNISIFEYAKAAAKEGSRYVIFKIEDPGQANYNFSNSVGDIPLKSALDGGSSMIKNIEYSLAGGNVLGQLASDAIGYTKDVILGNLDGVTLGLSNVVQALIDGGSLSMPKMVTGSSYDPPSFSLKIPLVCTSGDPISRLLKLYIPIAVAINMVAPRATGNASYNAPFIGRFFIRGRQSIELGVVSGLSLTAGTSNLGYNAYQQPLAFELTLNIIDLSDIAAAPVQTGLLGAFNMSLDNSNPMFNLLAGITGMDLYNYSYMLPKFWRRLAGLRYSGERLMSNATWGNLLADNVLGRLYGGVTHHNKISEMMERENRR